MNFIKNLVHKFPKSIIVLTILGTVFFAFQLRNIQVNTDLKTMFPGDDPIVKTFDRVSEKYGGAEYVVVMMHDDDMVDVPSLNHLNQLTDTLSTFPGVTKVRSITNIEEIRGDGFSIEVGKLMESLPKTAEACANFKQKIQQNSRYIGTLVSKDFEDVIVFAQLKVNADQKKIVAKIQGIAQSHRFPEQIYLAGSPVFTEEMANNMRSDITRLLPFVCLVVMVILFLGFRSLRGVFMPLVIVLIGVVWTIGFSAWLHKPLSVISTGLPILLVSIGSAYAIHLLSRFYEDQHNGLDKREAISESILKVGLAILMAGLTTVIGFLSLGISRLSVIRDFGLFTAFGVVVALIISVTFLPASLLVMRDPKRFASAEKGRFLDPLFRKINQLVLNYAGTITVVVVILLGLAIWVIPKIHPETNYVIFFPKKSEVRKAYHLINEKFGGSTSLEVVVNTGKPNGIESPEFLSRMNEFQDSLEAVTSLSNAMSVIDLLKEENKALHGNEETYNVLPPTGIAQYLLLLESDDDAILDDFIDFNHEEARIRVMTTSTQSEKTQQMLVHVESLADRYFRSSGDKVTVTGVPVLSEKLMNLIVSGQVRSLISAVIFAFLVTSLLLRSWGKGLACSLPIAVVVILNFGIMGWSSIPLDVATSMIASIAVGIGIDYSIHFYTRFQEEREQGLTVNKAIEQAIHTVGRANYFNAIAVTAGFMVLLFSTFPPLRTFGMLSSVTMVLSFLGAMILLPSLIVLREKYLSRK